MENNSPKIIYGRIEEFDGDVIVNSVGVESTKYGGICKSIILASESKELKDTIDGVKGLYNVGDFFVTEGYKLKVKNIYHIVTPKGEYDPYFIQIEECLRKFFNECKRRNWKRIGIPSIGTGANELDTERVRQIIYEMSAAYLNIHSKANISITLVWPTADISEKNDKRIEVESYSEHRRHSPEVEKLFKKGSKDFNKTIEDVPNSKYNKTFFNYEFYKNGNDDVILDIKKSNPLEIEGYVKNFINKSLKKNNDYYKEEDKLKADAQVIMNRLYMYLGSSKKGKSDYMKAGINSFYGISTKTKGIDKALLFKIIFALQMSVKEATNFLNYYGYTFAYPGTSDEDDLVKELLNNHIYGMVEVNLRFKKKKLPILFGNS